MDDVTKFRKLVETLISDIDKFKDNHDDCKLLNEMLKNKSIEIRNSKGKVIIETYNNRKHQNNCPAYYNPLERQKLSLVNILNSLNTPNLPTTDYQKLKDEYDEQKESYDVVIKATNSEIFIRKKTENARIARVENLITTLSEFCRSIDDVEFIEEINGNIQALEHILEHSINDKGVLIGILAYENSEDDFNTNLKKFESLPEEINKRIENLKEKLTKSEQLIVEYKRKFSELQKDCRAINYSPVPELKYFVNNKGTTQEKLKKNDEYIKGIFRDTDLMLVAVAEHGYNIQKKSKYLKENYKFSKKAIDDIDEFIKNLSSEPLNDRIVLLDDMAARMKERKDITEKLAEKFISSIPNLQNYPGLTQLQIMEHIDNHESLKSILKHKDIPKGLLYCIKDLTYWNPAAKAEDWEQIKDMFEAYNKQEIWAQQSVELYSAIYSYPNIIGFENIDIKKYNKFKQNSCMEIFSNKSLFDKKTVLVNNFEKIFPHESCFLQWLVKTIEWLEKKFNLSLNSDFFKPKIQKGLKAEIELIKELQNDDVNRNNDQQCQR